MEPRNTNAPRAEDGPQWGPRESLTLLNHKLRRVDGPEKVTGRARYTHDIRLPGMVWARLVLCAHPTAEVEIDCAAARKLPGVLYAAGLGGRDKLTTGYLGQPIAVVAAETPELAEDALRAVVVRAKPLPFALDEDQAQAEGAGKVRKNGNVGEARTRGELAEFDKVFATCDAKVEARYRLPIQHHCSLETHGVVVDFRGGDQATVYASTQGTFTIPDEAAEALGLKAGNVTAIVDYMGGGFGAKFGLGAEGQAACQVARELRRPVHLMLTREDEFLTGGNRSGSVIELRAGARKDGKLLALAADVTRLGGIGGGSFASLPYIYKVRDAEKPERDSKAVHTAVRSVYTHLDASRAMRAPGHPQASFPMECALDELAFQLGLDALAIRLANVDGDVWKRQLQRAAREIGWDAHPNKVKPQERPDADGTKTGIGFALGVWGGGGHEECKVKVAIGRDGSLESIVGTQDLGTGSRTYVAAIAAEDFGLPLSAAVAKIGNSNYGRANASGGSTTTASLAPAVKDAAFRAARAFREHLAKGLGRPAEELAFRGGSLVEAQGGKALMTWKEACATLGAAGISGDGEWRASLATNGVHGAQAVKVKVDLATGRVQVVKMVGVQDCGLPLNRTAVESQLNGGMIQAISYALHEERVVETGLGLVLNANFVDYKIAGSLEMPELVPLIDDDDIGRGVVGMAESAIVPGHSAIANAIFNACGVRLRSLPFTPDRVLDGLARLAANGGAK